MGAMSRPASELPAVELDRVVRTFSSGSAADPIVAVEELSVAVAQGEVVGLLGPNGAGKSTVIGMMCGLITPTSGRVLVEGFDVVRERRRIARRVGVVFDGART
ncbi:MAG TPA: methionine ABC transporter ATP-binding protein, partial [Firmicutes bacterium]|nr:methionine ABC transporter ATP-binding protein [Bacillota bacterium]